MSADIFTKNLSVIGSTGSIGTTALKTAKNLGIKVCAITGHSNLELLKKQADEFLPDIVGVTDPKMYAAAERLFGNKLVTGKDALTVPCGLCDTALISVVGVSGLTALEAAIKNKKRVALANKESLVAGGAVFSDLLKRQKAENAEKEHDGDQLRKQKTAKHKTAEIIPVDSEHSAIFQCLKAGLKRDLSRIILTASGGAFYNYNVEQLKKITPADIFHPNWSMGRKITLDSCTMMNKALEIIEAYWLFLEDRIDCADKTEKIDYVVHPESIIHSMAEFTDGTTMAQIANPDMSLPISYALTYPARGKTITPFKFDKPLTFLKKNPLFFAPELALEALKTGGSAGAVLNAANEAAVDLFEKRLICFTDIVKIVQKCLMAIEITPIKTVDTVFEIHAATIEKVKADYKSYISN